MSNARDKYNIDWILKEILVDDDKENVSNYIIYLERLVDKRTGEGLKLCDKIEKLERQNQELIEALKEINSSFSVKWIQKCNDILDKYKEE